MDGSENPYQSPTTEPDRNRSRRPGEHHGKSETLWVFVLPLFFCQLVYWGVFALVAKLGGSAGGWGDYGITEASWGLVLTILSGLFYGALLGKSLQHRHWRSRFYHPISMSLFQGFWFGVCLVGGCTVVGGGPAGIFG